MIRLPVLEDPSEGPTRNERASLDAPCETACVMGPAVEHVLQSLPAGSRAGSMIDVVDRFPTGYELIGIFVEQVGR